MPHPVNAPGLLPTTSCIHRLLKSLVLSVLLLTPGTLCSDLGHGRHVKHSHHHRSSVDAIYSVTNDAGPGGWISRGPQSTIAPAGDEVMFECELSLTAERLTWLHQPEGGNRSESDYKELNEHADFDKDGYQMSFHGMVGSLRVLADPHLPTGSGKFRCSVRFGPLSLVSTPARLELAALDDFRLDAEWIASQRDSDGLRLRAPVGSRVMMRCPEVKSSPQAVIQFYKFNRPLAPNVPQLPSGAVVLESVAISDSGRYTCSALNEINDEVAATTLAFSLQVYRPEQREPPRFLQPLRSLYTVAAGTRVLLECVGVGEPQPSVQWSKQGAIIGQADNSKDGTHHQRNDNKYTGLDPIQIGNGKYRSSSDLYETSDQMMGNGADGRTFNMPRILITEYGLLIENATLQDTGLYECALIDPSRRYPPVKQQIRLDVESAPEFPESSLIPNSQPQFNLSLFAEEGSRIDLHCSAFGVPPPKIYWMLNARPAETEPGVTVEKGWMIIDPVSRAHAGAVQCFASNKVGERYRAGVLRVSVAEVTGEAETDNKNAEGINGTVGKMGHRQYAEPSDGKSLPHHRMADDRHQGGNRSSGTPKKGHRGKEGRGRGRGRDKKRNKNVMIPPSRPNVTRLTDESVMVRWSVPDNDGLEIYFFKVQYRDLTASSQTHQRTHPRKGWITTNDEIPPHIRSYEVNNLEPDHVYRFHIAAVYSNNDNMQGPNSEKFHLQRGEFLGKRLLPAPILIRTETLGPTVIQIHWQYIPDPTRPADGFYLYFRPASTAGEYVKETVDGERSRVHRIEHLTPDTTYEVKVQSFTADGASDFSAILTQRTMKQPTEPPTPMVILDHRPSSAASASASSGSSVVNMNETMDKDKNRQGDSSSGALAVGGGTAGGLAAVLVLGAAAIYALRKKKREKNERDHSERDEGDEDGRISSDNKDGDFANIQDKQEGHISESNGYITASAINPHNSYQLKTVQITANGCARVNITSNPLAEEQSDKNASVTLTELEMEMSLLSQNNNMSGSSSGSAANNSDSMDKRQYSGAACPGHGQPPLHKKMMRNGGLQVSRRNEVNMNSNSSIENYV